MLFICCISLIHDYSDGPLRLLLLRLNFSRKTMKCKDTNLLRGSLICKSTDIFVLNSDDLIGENARVSENVALNTNVTRMQN